MSIKKTYVLGFAALGFAVLLYADSSWLTGTTDDKLNQLANIQPGLGTVMIEYSNRLTNSYYAAQAGNWGLAAYNLKEMVEIQEVGETTRPARQASLQAFEKGALAPLAQDVVNQDLASFNNDFQTAVTLCNGCHQANGFGYIAYNLPAVPAAPLSMPTAMTFSTDDLKSLLSALLGN